MPVTLNHNHTFIFLFYLIRRYKNDVKSGVVHEPEIIKFKDTGKANEQAARVSIVIDFVHRLSDGGPVTRSLAIS